MMEATMFVRDNLSSAAWELQPHNVGDWEGWFSINSDDLRDMPTAIADGLAFADRRGITIRNRGEFKA